MNHRRAKPAIEPTIVDTIITAVAPALIICMISSLVFFLIIAFYRSEYSFAFDVYPWLVHFRDGVGSKNCHESGRTHANLFGIALFAAACVAMFSLRYYQRTDGGDQPRHQRWPVTGRMVLGGSNHF